VAGTDDDIIILGGRRRHSARDEVIEELFHADYPRLVHRAFAVLGNRDLAEQVSTQAYLSLWRHWPSVGDHRRAPAYLDLRVASLAGKIVKRGAPHCAGPSPTVPELDQDAIDEPPEVDTARAWRDFEALRARGSVARRRQLAAAIAVVAVVAVAIAYPVIVRRPPASHTPRQSVPGAVTTYPRAVVARFALSGVIYVVGDSMRAWAVRAAGQPGTATIYQLVGLDLHKNTVLYRKNLGPEPRAIAAGAGRVWLTTQYGQAGGQIVRVNPATGQVVRTLHLPTGRCTALSFSAGHLFANCGVRGSTVTGFWRINPHTERVWQLTGPVYGFLSSIVAAPEALWYIVNYTRISGFSNVGGNPQLISPQNTGFQARDMSPGFGGLVYDAGSIWVLGGVEKLTRIDAVTGKVVQSFTYRNYDPAGAGGLNFLTAGAGWLWFLDNGYPFSGVLRVSEETGRAAGGVPIPPNSCGQQVCSHIFFTPRSVWVPTAELLIRIDPAQLPR
jgi:hypothetical protein